MLMWFYLFCLVYLCHFHCEMPAFMYDLLEWIRAFVPQTDCIILLKIAVLWTGLDVHGET